MSTWKMILPDSYCDDTTSLPDQPYQGAHSPPGRSSPATAEAVACVRVCTGRSRGRGADLSLDFVTELDGIGAFELEVKLHLGRVPDAASALGLERPVVEPVLVRKMTSDNQLVRSELQRSLELS